MRGGPCHVVGVMVADEVGWLGPRPYLCRLCTPHPALVRRRACSVCAWFWQVDVVDAQGAFVDDATNIVTFSLSGAGTLAGTANGDPACHVNNLSPTRPAYWGKVLAVVLAGDESGLVRRARAQ